jgi:cysteine desulfurase
MARHAIEEARNTIGICLGIDADRIVFTSGATESNNSALHYYALEGERNAKKHIVVSDIEHPSVLEYCYYLRDGQGFDLTVIKPSSNGIVNTCEVARSIRSDTCLVCVMGVNNEVGTIQPFEDIYDLCKASGVRYHCDMTQAVSLSHKIYRMEDASFSFSGHKFHAPKGIGFLIAPEGSEIFPGFLLGGSQEEYRRSGTENVAGIVAMATAFRESYQCGHWKQQIRDLRNMMYADLCKEVGGVFINGDYANSVPNILNVSFDGVHGDALASALSNVYGICCSTGSACCAGEPNPSRVLKAMGLTDERALGAVRVSFSRYNTESDVQYFVQCCKKSIDSLRTIS